MNNSAMKKRAMRNRAMIEGAPWKHILRFALPVLAGSLLQQLYSTVDTIIVGNFADQNSLAAVGTTGSFTFMFMALAIGFSAGNGVIVAQHYGAGRMDEVRRTASTGIILLLGMSLAATGVSLLLARPAFEHVIGVPDAILGDALIYFNIYALGLIFQFGYNIFSSILRALGDSAATLYFLLISSVLNVGLDLLFVAVFEWGVMGAALATDIAQAVSFVAAYLYMTRKYPVFRFKLKEYTWDSRMAKKTLMVGSPIALQMVIVSVGFSFIQRAVNDFGEDMTASFTVGQRIEMYLNLPCNAFQTTLATYAGQNIGAGRMDNVKRGVRQTIAISVGMTLLISGAVWLSADSIIHLFGIGETALGFCRDHVRTVAFINLVLAVYIPLFGVFQASNHAFICTIVATTALSIRVMVTYLFRYSDFLGHSIIWWNGLFGFGVACIVTWSFYLSGRWQRNAWIAAE